MGNWGVTQSTTLDVTAAPDTQGPVTYGIGMTPNPTEGAASVTLTATVDDTTMGNSNIAEAEYFVDSVGADGTGVAMNAVAAPFNNPVEDVTVDIDVSGWTVGTYTLYVHGRDSVGNWGTTISTTLDVTATADIIPPQVVSNDPANGAGGAVVSSNIVIVFNEEMNQANTEGAFEIVPAVTGTFSWNVGGDTLTFNPDADLDYATAYTITIHTTATDLAGNTLDGDKDGNSEADNKDKWVFSFNTEAMPTPPQVVSHTPTSGATDVPLSSNIVITFSEEMNQASVESYFSISPSVAGAFSWNVGGDTLTFNPSSDLDYGTQYTVTIDGLAEDLEGETLDGDKDGTSEGSPTDDYQFSFDTELPPPPQVTANSPTGTSVDVNSAIIITFNMAMHKDANGKAPWEAGSVEEAISLSNGWGAGDFTLSWNGAVDQLTLTPKNPFPGSTTITVTIAGTAQDSTATQTLDGDKDGTSEGSPTDDHDWSFTTGGGGGSPPQVIEPTTPSNGASGVAKNTNIVIEFTEAMNEASVESYFSISPAAAGAFSWNPGSTILTFNPNPDLATNTLYTITIDGLAEDQQAETLDGDKDGSSEGSPTDDHEFTFTTEVGSVNKYAVCVGIDKHDDGSTCVYADNDGQDWTTHLTGEGYSVTKRLNTAADKAVILGDIADMDTSENAGDYCAFTFAGHGGISNPTAYIVCADYAGTWGTVISDAELQSAFSGFSSTHIFIFLDSCHSGGMNEVAASGRLFISACTGTQSSYGGDSSMQNGVWTWFFLEDGIQTQGLTVMESCFSYAVPEAKSWLSANYGVTMDPQMSDQYAGDFIL